MSALPFLVMWLWGYVWGSMMDRLTAAKKISLLAIRRLSMALGEWLSGVRVAVSMVVVMMVVVVVQLLVLLLLLLVMVMIVMFVGDD